MTADRDVSRLRRRAGWALVAGLCVAGAVAIVALLAGSFGDTEARVVAMSLGFSVFSSTAAAGAALRARPAAWPQALGAATGLASLVSFVLLTAALWLGDDSDALWRAFWVAGLAALWTSHASLVLRTTRPGDTRTVRRLGAIAIVSLGVDSAVGSLAILGALDDVDAEPFARALAVLVVVAILSSALIPILRRLSRPTAPPREPAAAAAFGAPAARPRAALPFADEVAEVAERLARMPLPPEARAEVARLRELSRDAAG